MGRCCSLIKNGVAKWGGFEKRKSGKWGFWGGRTTDWQTAGHVMAAK